MSRKICNTPGRTLPNTITITHQQNAALKYRVQYLQDLIEEQKILIQKLYRENHLLRCQSLIDSSNNNIKYKI